MILIAIVLSFIAIFGLRKWFQLKLRYRMYFAQRSAQNLRVGFFHPYCNAGGGGERVLWAAIRTLQLKYPTVHCFVYTGDTDVTKEDILKKVYDRFNIVLPRDVDFIFLKKRYLVDATMYPYFTLLFQSLGSMILGLEALFKFIPDIYLDSMGYAFTLPIFKYIGCCPVGCYVHYPTISTDMLDAVSERRNVVNNKRFISRSKYLTSLKLMYYKIFAFIYGFVGRRADIVMVNSSWTKEHIVTLWKNYKTFLVYPPCDVTEFQNIPIPDATKNNKILSIAQFRPEKDHALQIKSFHKYLTNIKSENDTNIKLILAGGCRSEEDKERVNNLKKLCSELGILNCVEFKVNISFNELLSEMSNAGIALHSMWNEHFGISVVEAMAAGQIIIAHDSGGPKLDIVKDYHGNPTGFLADTVDKYADLIDFISKMSSDKQLEIRKNARKSAERFSTSNFEQSFYDVFQTLLP